MRITNSIVREEIENVAVQIYTLIKSEPNLTPRSRRWITDLIKKGGFFVALSGHEVKGFIVREHVWGKYYEIKSWYCVPNARNGGLAHELFRRAIDLPGAKFISVTFFYRMVEKLQRYGYVQIKYIQLPLPVSTIFLIRRPWASVMRHMFKKKSYLILRP